MAAPRTAAPWSAGAAICGAAGIAAALVAERTQSTWGDPIVGTLALITLGLFAVAVVPRGWARLPVLLGAAAAAVLAYAAWADSTPSADDVDLSTVVYVVYNGAVVLLAAAATAIVLRSNQNRRRDLH